MCPGWTMSYYFQIRLEGHHLTTLLVLCRLQSNFESNPQAYIYESELFKLYQTKFINHGPMLRSADLVTVSRVGFPRMETALVQETEGMPPVQVIRGIAKKSWVDFSGGLMSMSVSSSSLCTIALTNS
jgi:hypothetical protein